jgi:hypothetical protein
VQLRSIPPLCLAEVSAKDAHDECPKPQAPCGSDAEEAGTAFSLVQHHDIAQTAAQTMTNANACTATTADMNDAKNAASEARGGGIKEGKGLGWEHGENGGQIEEAMARAVSSASNISLLETASGSKQAKASLTPAKSLAVRADFILYLMLTSFTSPLGGLNLFLHHHPFRLLFPSSGF